MDRGPLDDLANLCCQNPACSDYGQRGRGNLRVGFRYGPRQRRVLACRTCQHRFSERKGTPLFDTRLTEDQAIAVLRHLQDGCGIRQTSRLVGVNKNTVIRLAKIAGRHAERQRSAASSRGRHRCVTTSRVRVAGLLQQLVRPPCL